VLSGHGLRYGISPTSAHRMLEHPQQLAELANDEAVVSGGVDDRSHEQEV